MEVDSSANNLPLKRKKKWIHGRSLYLEVRIAPPDAYPDLVNNPSNPYNLLSDEDRLKDFIEALAILWSETCQDKAEEMSAKAAENKLQIVDEII